MKTGWLLARYLAIGGFVFAIEIASFQAFVHAGFLLPVATSLSFLLAVSAHFTLNRFFNFRNFERTIVQQAGTYAVVAAFALFVQNAIVQVGVHVLTLSPLAAKVAGIAVNVPLGFLGHRYLTFGRGIGAALRRLYLSAGGAR